MKMDLRREELERKAEFRRRELESKNNEMDLRLEDTAELRLLLQLQLRNVEELQVRRGALLNPSYLHQEQDTRCLRTTRPQPL
ncbi:hypothetical protein PsorP6_012765 [Peronosclerospora sorghi]|uniref:Uncharacterized protein n=1 Tax=Peronosclerospora sorghi TaxID=230839 RepID=A0ACC0WH64_9STRA|nr:hypothetical protein PsorP6_012765 [Peronosclerospora sorghi]